MFQTDNEARGPEEFNISGHMEGKGNGEKQQLIYLTS